MARQPMGWRPSSYRAEMTGSWESWKLNQGRLGLSVAEGLASRGSPGFILPGAGVKSAFCRQKAHSEQGDCRLCSRRLINGKHPIDAADPA